MTKKRILASTLIFSMACSLFVPATGNAMEKTRTDQNKDLWVLVKETNTHYADDAAKIIKELTVNTLDYNSAGKLTTFQTNSSSKMNTSPDDPSDDQYEIDNLLRYDDAGHITEIKTSQSHNDNTESTIINYTNNLVTYYHTENTSNGPSDGALITNERTENYTHNADHTALTSMKQRISKRRNKTEVISADYTYYTLTKIDSDPYINVNYNAIKYDNLDNTYDITGKKGNEEFFSKMYILPSDYLEIFDLTGWLRLPKITTESSDNYIVECEYDSQGRISKILSVEQESEYHGNAVVYNNWKYDVYGNPLQCDYSTGTYRVLSGKFTNDDIFWTTKNKLEWEWKDITDPSKTSSDQKPATNTNPAKPGANTNNNTTNNNASNNSSSNTSQPSSTAAKEYTVSNNVYVITKAISSKNKIGEVTLLRPAKKTKKLSIPATIKIGKDTYNVTVIADNAFKKNTKLSKLTIGKNVTKIGKNAFSGCKKLKTIKISTTKLTKKKVGKNAFAGIHKKAKITVPAKKLKSYKKILKAKGVKTKTQKIVSAK